MQLTGPAQLAEITDRNTLPKQLRGLPPRHGNRSRSSITPAALATPEVSSFVAQVGAVLSSGSMEAATSSTAVSGVIEALTAETVPGPLRLIASDIASIAAMSPTLPGIGRLGLLWYTLFGRPAPIVGFVDFYITGPISSAIGQRLSTDNFTLRERMGGGNYGQVFEGMKTVAGEERVYSKQLTPEQKKRRVVLKRVNLDRTGVRANFLTAGTIAQGAAETGVVEAYMCSKLKLHPQVRKHTASYIGSFTADKSEGGFTKGTQWLVWEFESDSTLADACDGKLGRFPEALAPMMIGNNAGTMNPEKRDALTVKSIFKQVLQGLDALHSVGVVHRDVKPENLLITGSGRVLFIDFGAAVDMCTGVNFNPQYGMLDPRYAPPEDLVMPKEFPRAPPTPLAAGLAPLAWLWGRPDLFDSYSAGVLLLQLAVPQLRASASQKSFNDDFERNKVHVSLTIHAKGIAQVHVTTLMIRGGHVQQGSPGCYYTTAQCDLDLWRKTSPKARLCDFTLLDRNNGAGWDLAKKLLCERNSLNRGRLSAGEALRHRYFFPEF